MGGAAGHMNHPFDLPSVKNGADLINFFKNAGELLLTSPGSVKIDGVNVSFKLIDGPRGKEFAVDRGSLKPIDVEGITVDRIGERFPEGHGMRGALADLLSIFNEALPAIEPELKKLGLYDDPTKFFNTEYVKGTTNVLQYDEDFLAIHGINQFYQKTSRLPGKAERPGAERPTDSNTGKPIKDPSKEVSYDADTLLSLIKKVNPYAEKQGFKIYGDVPTETVADINFDSTLNSDFTVVFSEEDQITMPLKEWLARAVNPKGKKIELVDGRKIDALSKHVYMSVLGGMPLTSLVKDSDDAKLAVDAAVFYHATRVLGNDVMNALTSPMGDIVNHEGVIVRDVMFGPKPVKITGEFIVKGLETSFPRGSVNEQLEDDQKRIIAIYPGRFQPMGRHHAEVFKKIQEKYGEENAFIATSGVVKQPKSPFSFSEKQMIIASHGIDPTKVVRTKNPYAAAEVLNTFNPITTSVVYLVGAKDMEESPRFANLGGLTKDGTPAYFRRFDSEVELEGYEDHGYIDVAPHVSIDIPKYGEMSGTTLRKVLRDADFDTFKEIMKISNVAIYELIKDKLSALERQLEEQKKTFSLLFSLVEEALEEKKENCFEKGKYKTFAGKSKCIQRTKGLGKKRADAYVASVLRDMGELDEEASMAGGAISGFSGRAHKRDKDDLVEKVVNYLLKNSIMEIDND